MTSWSILGHTAKVLEERRDDYGDPADQFKAIAARWSITLDMPVTPAQVALCMIDLKLTRLGYLAQGGQIIDATVIAAPRQKLSDDEKAMIKVGKAADEIWPDAPAKPRPRRRRGHVRCCQPPVESVTIGIYPEREVRILEGR